MNEAVKSVVIVGGGTAGWLTAGMIAAEHQSSSEGGVTVTLIESPDIKAIGVGEGTWPTMRETLRKIGVSETDFMRECDVTFKQGSKFQRWVSGSEDDFFYQPFMLPQGYYDCNLLPHWQQFADKISFSNAVCHQQELCEANLAPKTIATPEYEGELNYAYHLNAGTFAGFLQRHCTEKLGVRHLRANVTSVNMADNGDIASVVTDSAGDVAGDLFVDCTGFAALLIGKQLGVEYVSRQDVLFIDTALAVQVPYESDDTPIASQTISTAQEAGWIWDIGLTSRRGVGYVYSSRFIEDERAESQLRDYLRPRLGNAVEALQFRKIPINSGHRETFWKNNCVAVGLSAGFLEPLEASAIAMVEYSARMICERLPATRSVMDHSARYFNDRMHYHWGRVIDFLKLHYVLSRRDEPFWQENRNPDTIPQSLKDLLEEWRYRFPEHNEFSSTDEVFPAAGYQYVMYGMGFRTEMPGYLKKSYDARMARQLFERNREITQRYLAEMPGNRELLAKINKFGMQAI